MLIFGRKKLNPFTKCTTEVIDQVNGNSNSTELLVKKYIILYNSVETSEKENCELNSAIVDGVTSLEVSNYQVKPYILSILLNDCSIIKLDDGSIGFNSNHLLYCGKRLHVLLALLFSSFFFRKNYYCRARGLSVCPSVCRLWK